MARGEPRNIVEELRKLEEKQAALMAKLRKEESKLQAANRRQLIRFVEAVGADGLEPELIMGMLLEGSERAKNPMHASIFRRKGQEYFTARAGARAAKRTQEPLGDAAGASQDTGGPGAPDVQDAA